MTDEGGSSARTFPSPPLRSLTTKESKNIKTYNTTVQAAKSAHDTGAGFLDTATETTISETAQAMASRRAMTMADE